MKTWEKWKARAEELEKLVEYQQIVINQRDEEIEQNRNYIAELEHDKDQIVKNCYTGSEVMTALNDALGVIRDSKL